MKKAIFLLGNHYGLFNFASDEQEHTCCTCPKIVLKVIHPILLC